ncbi:alpha-amylase family protein [Sphingobacterium gobiense]|uniref:Alpha-amylase n=1 Tax=Sphingobacterium gobiense TaxID=1382456 RepID=A0A2S9JL20_9SPHI|nr:alpha-amylase family protein [Sphingobacterium gobiense]PRD53850.1 trehalose synthase [Sphingobacterium gobiense]
MNKHWYKKAVIYSLDVEDFMDANGDGVGDFQGLIERIPYLSALGIDCIWLLPFYGSPNKDDGYDVSNYFEVDKRLGNLGNFAEFVDAATKAGIRVLVDLVINHTSVKHPWFIEAAKDKASKYRNFYIWADEKPDDDGKYAIFGPDQDYSNWEYSRKTKQWYYHTFYNDQPDLNMTNPAVQEEIFRIINFWLKLGISGFRIDAAPHIIRQKGDQKFDGDRHDIFRKIRQFVKERNPEAVLIAEVNVKPKRYSDFFGKGDQMHMLFNFYINNYIFVAFARGKATPLLAALDRLPTLHYEQQMANFLRNHDELNLEQLSDKEREEVFEVFAPDEDMRIFDRGIRRRLAPMLQNDRKKLELAYSLLLTLPGTPVLRYGQELGMGEALSKEGRNSVRTVMQWHGGKNGGFSKAATEELVEDIITKGPYGYRKVNAKAESLDPNSLLNWLIKAIRIRKQLPEIGDARFEIIPVNSEEVMAIRYESTHRCALILHNFSGNDVHVKIEMEDMNGYLEVFSNESYEEFNPKKRIQLSAFGYRWMQKRQLFD